MEKNSLQQRLVDLNHKIERLIAVNHQLRQQLAECQNENPGYENQNVDEANKGKGFINQINLAKIVDSNSVELSDTAALKELINEYIQEIDHCLAQLSK
jgi:hypothetical protein